MGAARGAHRPWQCRGALVAAVDSSRVLPSPASMYFDCLHVTRTIFGMMAATFHDFLYVFLAVSTRPFLCRAHRVLRPWSFAPHLFRLMGSGVMYASTFCIWRRCALGPRRVCLPGDWWWFGWFCSAPTLASFSTATSVASFSPAASIRAYVLLINQWRHSGAPK